MTRSNLPILFMVCMGVGLFVHCAGPETPEDPEEVQSPTSYAVEEPNPDLLAHEWHLEAFGVISEEDAVLPDTSITLTFERDGGLSGTSGCNRYSTTFTAGASGELAVRALATTRMECAPETMQQEQAYLDALASVTGFDVGAASLQLFYGDDEYAMLFRGETRADSEFADE